VAEAGATSSRLGLLEWANATQERSIAVADEVGRAALVLLQLAFVPVLVLTLLLYARHARRMGVAMDLGDFGRVILGVAGLFGGLAVFFAFTLTWPPAINQLDQLTVKCIGLLAGLPMFVYAWREVIPRLFPKQAPMPPGAEPSVSPAHQLSSDGGA
jgi:hypothetical protein